MKSRNVVISLLLLTVIGSSPAFAQPKACAKDIKTYCKHVQKDANAAKNYDQCLKEHQQYLSPPCLAAHTGKGERKGKKGGKEGKKGKNGEAKEGQQGGETKAAKKAEGGTEGANECSADLKKFCPGVAQGKGKRKECLQKHHNELSPACKAKFQKGKD